MNARKGNISTLEPIKITHLKNMSVVQICFSTLSVARDKS